ncbi:MAG: hypothetical protein JWR44_3709 [Hymenobacter sp.]|jgi:hypothetical protein|nr:hypothetical protein [Hymenobacter sp.]
MKNSLKFLTAAGLLLLGSLTAYNTALRAEYRLGTFKNPLRNYDALSLTNFNTLNVPAAGLLRAKVEVGPFGVFVNKEAVKYLHVTQQGTQLTVALNYPDKEEYLGHGEAIIIRCPRLSALTAGGTYTLAGKPATAPRNQGPNGQVLIKGFSQDSLQLVEDHNANVLLIGNQLGHLQAQVGAATSSAPTLNLEGTNRIDSSDLRVEGHGKLVANDLALPALRWHFGDSARVELSGAALRSLR